MEELFSKIVEQVFNNWTALRLAVEHSMGGPNSKQTANECLNYMVQYCLYEKNVQVDDIQEALEDILDQEFDTVCEDGSPKEVAQVLFKFMGILRQGNMQEYELEYQRLPTCNQEWMNAQKPTAQNNTVDDPSSSHENIEADPIPMEEDPEWTQVKSRRKR